MKTFLTLQGQPDSIFYLPRKYLDHHIKFNILLYTTPKYMVTFKGFYLSVLGLRAKQKLKKAKKKKKKTWQIPRGMTKHCATSEINMFSF